MKKQLLAVLFGATLVLGACGGDKADDKDTSTDTGTSTETAAADGEAIYQANSCVSCHGGNLEGGAGPALDKVGGSLSEDEIHGIIVDGKPGMPAGIIEGEEATAVAKWLAEKK
ncbi:cytochrome c551 [Sporosarcina siberiensis]|uniref:Cytochrome c551 n=1 Tax=Sporosarcina siberiensis TaxID=1365606 RepID=A0ABW4SE25_9BACL